MKLILDDWQKEVIKTKGNMALCSGRQVGKSTIVAMKAAEEAANNPNYSVMVISATERQAYLLYAKILDYLMSAYKNRIQMGKNRPTKSEIKLVNGSIIRCLPTGLSGLGIRGYTIQLLIADEASFINEDVWSAVVPALATTNGIIWLLSTPHIKEGYFYKAFDINSNFTKFHVNAEEVAEKRAEPQRTYMLEHQKRQKEIMTKAEYAAEYLGEFVDELRQMFSDELIRNSQVLERKDAKGGVYYLGVDVARMGEDESTFEIIEKINENNFIQIENIMTRKTLTTDTTDKILQLNRHYDFKKILVDTGGVGAAVFDMLLKEDSTKRKVVSIDNASKPLSRDGKQKTKILKEDLYMNLLAMLEKGKLTLLKDDEISRSLKSIHYEHDDKGRVIISGNYSHIVEGLIRAAFCNYDKSLNIWCR